jgi:CRISPR-associated endoribonuclease Cas6
MSALTALVVEVEAVNPGTIDGATGQAVQGFWLHHWRSLDPQLSQTMHDPAAVKPYTVSPLMGLSHPQRGCISIARGQRAWFRVVSLDAQLSQRLAEEWLPLLPETIPIAGLEWKILRTALDQQQHPWAGQTDFSVLTALAHNGAGAQEWHLQLTTPTTFKFAKYNLPFPLPGLLVHSWRSRWNETGGEFIPDEVEEQAKTELVVSAYALKTVPVRSPTRVLIGCVGELTLKAVGLDAAACQAVDALCSFAFWAGSGQHTTQGLGMTRLVSDGVKSG